MFSLQNSQDLFIFLNISQQQSSKLIVRLGSSKGKAKMGSRYSDGREGEYNTSEVSDGNEVHPRQLFTPMLPALFNV